MKQVDLVRLLLRKGVIFVRHGANHDWYKNPSTGISEAIPRHREIKEQLAKKIIKNLL
jgi:predicted RNA binding protein YcfA (HicA-like mRNA interferase family)